jgi:hypothetical protein
MTREKYHAAHGEDQEHIWFLPDGPDAPAILQKIIDSLGPLKRDPETITIEQALEMEALWGLPFHEAADIFPLLDDASPEFKALVADIDERGQLEPITLLDGKVLDGRNRMRACAETGRKPITVDFSDANATSPLAFVLSKNLYRRHLTEGQQAMFALDLVTTGHGGNRKAKTTGFSFKPPIGGLIRDGSVSRAEAAKLCGLSLRNVERAAFVRDHAVPEIVSKVEAGRMTLGRAAMLAKEDSREQRAAPEVKFHLA